MDSWSFEHSVDCGVSPAFAWAFWTDVRNSRIDSDVVAVEIDGEFASGTSGRTVTRSSGTVQWRLAEVEPGRAVFEFPHDGGIARFAWTFEPIAGGVRMTQRASIEGPQASFGSMLEAGIPAGMQTLCAAMTKAAGAS